MINESDKTEWGEPGQPVEGGVLPEEPARRGRKDSGRSRRHPRGTGGSNGTPASNN